MRTLSRTFLSWSIFPVIFLTSLGVAMVTIEAGYHPATVAALISIAVGAILVLMELVQPHSSFWHRSQGDVGTDVAHLFLSTMLIPPIFSALFRSLLLIGAAWLALRVGFPLWPHHWPLWIQLVIALCVAEFGQYWWHRGCHQWQPLWRFHATHHSPRRLYWLNSCRFHPVDSLAQYALEVSPLVLLGTNPKVLALLTLSTAVIGMFQHANIELKIGVLNWVFSMTELHRWHHSRDIREGNSNYGANLILWDIVFGTRFYPKQRQLSANNVGISNMPNFPRDYLGQLISPFRWRRLQEEAARRTPRPKGRAPRPKGRSTGKQISAATVEICRDRQS